MRFDHEGPGVEERLLIGAGEHRAEPIPEGFSFAPISIIERPLKPHRVLRIDALQARARP
jgi:hypothetical protein